MNRIAEALCAAIREHRQGDAPAPEVLSLTSAEWQEVAALAIRQRVGPLLLSRKHLPFPDDVRAQLRARAEMSAKRVLMQQAAFRELAAAVAPHGVSLIALKGLHLATSVYSSPGLREMNDIDVLVRPEHLSMVAAQARALGYRDSLPQPAPVAMDASHHLPPLGRGMIGLEIHWRLSPSDTPPHVSADELMNRSRPLPPGANTRSLCPEDAVLHLCVHAAGAHLLSMGLRPLCDIAALVARHDIQWMDVVERSAHWGCERSVGLMLTLAHRHFGVEIPDAAWTSLADALPTETLQDAAMVCIADNSPALAGMSEEAGRLIHISSARSRLRHIASRVALGPAELSRTYPGSERNVITRWIAIVRRAFSVTWRHTGWVVRASRDTDGPLRAAVDRRHALADWIRDR